MNNDNIRMIEMYIDYAIKDIKDMEKELLNMDYDICVRVFRHLHNFLNNSNMVSKFLFGSKKSDKYKKELIDLRKTLSIDNKTVFHFSKREIRNIFEHFDNILSGGDITDDLNIFNKNLPPNYSFSGKKNEDMGRRFHPDTYEIAYKDNYVNIKEILKEMNILSKRIKIYKKNNGLY